ncbi:DedA family protein [Deinococcus saxicola]|uniref:DedA family protein n=1 Tax=Deinococcus saxicola TaxID=249406 RepID=UPI0039F0CBFC
MKLLDWITGLDPAVLNLSTFGLLALEGAGIPGVPGVLPMLAQVSAIEAGHTTLTSAIFWGVLGNWLGSLLGYAAARWGGQYLPARWLEHPGMERTGKLLTRWGGPLVIVSRTIGSLRTPVTLLCGLTRFPFLAYVLLSLLGALLHVGAWQTALWKFGPVIVPQVLRWGTQLGLGAAALLLIVWLWRTHGGRVRLWQL